MSFAVGNVAIDGDGNRWRIVSGNSALSSSGRPVWRGKATIDGATRTREMGPVGISSTEAAPVYEVDEEVTIDGDPGVVIDRYGDGLDESPVNPNEITYIVRVYHTPPEFGSTSDDVRQVHAFTIDP